MMYLVLLPVHIASGIIGLLSGTLAMALRKGSRRHRTVGNLFGTVPGETQAGRLVRAPRFDEAGKITPVVDKCYTLNQVPEATRYLEQKHGRGKVVITVATRHLCPPIG